MSSEWQGGQSARIPSQANGQLCSMMRPPDRATNAALTVATGQKIAIDPASLAVAGESQRRLYFSIMKCDALGFEQDRDARVRDETVHYFGLSINDEAPARERPKVDAEYLAVDSKIDAVMDETIAPYDVAETARLQNIGAMRFEHACSHAGFHMRTAVTFDYDRLDAAGTKELRQRKAGWPCADNSDLRAQSHARRS